MTPTQISKLKPGCYPIPQHAGLRLEVRASRKTWTLRRRDEDGKLKQVALGHYPDMNLAAAMAAATGARQSLGKPKAVEAVTVRALVHAYCIGHIRVNRKDWRMCEARIWRHLGELVDRDAMSVGRADAHALIASKAGSPSVQRQTRMEMAAAWEYGIDAGLLPEGANPWARVRVPPPGVRSRVLSDAEIVTLWAWMQGSKLGQTRDAIVLTLATCCRSGELLKMRKQDVDLDRGEWHLRTAKNGIGRTVYLNAVALAVLRARLSSMQAGEERVFTAKGQHVFVNALYRVRESIGIDAFGMHDLRRTGRTLLARLGCPDEVGERLVGHAIGGVKAIYNQHSYATEQKHWIGVLGEHLQGLTVTK